jgi:hypothetical protein
VAALIFRTAAAMARDGSSGVENSLSVLRAPPSIHTQSVKVPPVSMEMRSSVRDARAMKREDYHRLRSIPYCELVFETESIIEGDYRILICKAMTAGFE